MYFRFRIAISGLTILLFLIGEMHAQAPIQLPVRTIKVGEGWSSNSVNTVIFRRNALCSNDSLQFTAYYDSSGQVILGRRKLGTEIWLLKPTGLKGNVRDAHNAISIALDGKGFLHLSWDHHNGPLHYAVSVSPFSLDLAAAREMIGDLEKKVSYPEFYRFPNGDLLFLYRDGSSGNGNLVMNRYRTSSQKWERVQRLLIDGEGKRNAYWQACIDGGGRIHLSWVWRESPNVASNHDLAYAFSEDGGLTWKKSDGREYTLPIREAQAEIAVHIPQNSDLINQTSMAATQSGQPYIVSYWRDSSSVPQYHLVHKTIHGWKAASLPLNTTAFSLSGAGTKRIPISRPLVLIDDRQSIPVANMLFRATNKGNTLQLARIQMSDSIQISQFQLNQEDLDSWEPMADQDLWKNRKQLHLFVQATHQADGEGMQVSSPSSITVLESDLTQNIASSDDYALVWNDEFNTDGLPDATKWNYENGFVRNEELQWYQPQNAQVKNGLLIIEARKESFANPRFQAESHDWRKKRDSIRYTSSCLLTRGKASWQYGRFEIRAKIDIRSGLWPAWWTLGEGPWPANGEIDIMEYYREMLLANIACMGSDKKALWFSNRFSTDSLGGSQWADSFHTWRMDWTAQSIALYLDDHLLNKVPLTVLNNREAPSKNPFQQPHYMLLNLALGGMNGGPLKGTDFPNQFLVDYVRVYQRL